jgi:iron complex outermembrane recepter protein
VNLSAGVVWKFVQDHALAFNITRTERHAQAAELYADGPHIAAGRVEVGDPDLDIEDALTADIALRHTGDSVNWTLSAFYNDYSSYIYLAPTGATRAIAPGEDLPVFEALQGGATLYGYEAEILFPLDLANGGTLEFRLASDFVRGKLKEGGNLPQMPSQRFGGGLHYEMGTWHAGLEAFYNLKQDDIAQYELPTDAYTAVNADVSTRVQMGDSTLFVFLRGSNLLDEEIRQASSPLKDRVPLPGRSVSAGVRLSF